jgi:hypothetical protein
MLKIDILIEFESADDFQIQSLTAVKLKSNKSSINWSILKFFFLPFFSRSIVLYNASSIACNVSRQQAYEYCIVPLIT